MNRSQASAPRTSGSAQPRPAEPFGSKPLSADLDSLSSGNSSPFRVSNQDDAGLVAFSPRLLPRPDTASRSQSDGWAWLNRTWRIQFELVVPCDRSRDHNS